LLGENLLDASGPKVALLRLETGDLLDGACSGISNDNDRLLSLESNTL
jgi:hypothetical protein